MRNDPSLLERFKEREEEIRRETAALDKEMAKKRVDQERRQQDVLAKLEKERAALAGMKADYKALEAELEGQARAEIEASSVTAKKVEAGEATVREYFAGGLSKKAIAAKAHGETGEKLADARKLIRAKAAEVFALEFEEADARMNVIFASTYPGQNQIARLKAEVQALEQGVSAVLYGYPKAAADRARFQTAVQLCEGKGTPSGLTWDSITYDELLDLRLDPRISDHKNFKASEALEEIIAAAVPGKRYFLAVSFSGWGRGPGFTCRPLDDDDAPGERAAITTGNVKEVK